MTDTSAPSRREGKGFVGLHGRSLVLLADDDPGLLKLVTHCLQAEGYRVITACEGKEALRLAETERPALVLLDVMMPGMNGFLICQKVRESSDVPVIMLTARGRTEDVVGGLDAGADDYVVKPFAADELLARVNAVLRRSRMPEATSQSVFISGDLAIDFGQRRVTVKGQEAVLTPTEYRILAMLASNAGRVITQDHLLQEVWGPEYVGDTHILQVAIARLRHKLNDGVSNPRYIVTRSGIGYSFKKPDAAGV